MAKLYTTEEMHREIAKTLASSYGITVEQAEQMRKALGSVVLVGDAKKYIAEHFVKEEPVVLLYSVPPQEGGKAVRGATPGVLYAPRKEVAFKGRYRVVASANEFYGGEKSKDYFGKVLVDPTWGALFAEAKKAVKATGDRHHVYFEGVYTSKHDPAVNGVTSLRLAMGS